jgi:serine phosphatase RsbU (regulator of sigma subunit)
METVMRAPPLTFPTHGVECAFASRVKQGERVSGDHAVAVPFADGVLVAAIDGLGHGEDAAAAAHLAAATLQREPGENLIALIQHCHRALTATRGAAMSLASLDTRRGVITWISVGNVEGIVVQSGSDGQYARARLITRGGVVGSALPILRAEVLGLVPGDLLVFATDGVDQSFGDELRRDPRRVDEIAGELLEQFGKKTDDSLVVVARIAARP